MILHVLSPSVFSRQTHMVTLETLCKIFWTRKPKLWILNTPSNQGLYQLEVHFLSCMRTITLRQVHHLQKFASEWQMEPDVHLITSLWFSYFHSKIRIFLVGSFRRYWEDECRIMSECLALGKLTANDIFISLSDQTGQGQFLFGIIAKYSTDVISFNTKSLRGKSHYQIIMNSVMKKKCILPVQYCSTFQAWVS